MQKLVNVNGMDKSQHHLATKQSLQAYQSDREPARLGDVAAQARIENASARQPHEEIKLEEEEVKVDNPCEQADQCAEARDNLSSSSSCSAEMAEEGQPLYEPILNKFKPSRSENDNDEDSDDMLTEEQVQELLAYSAEL